MEVINVFKTVDNFPRGGGVSEELDWTTELISSDEIGLMRGRNKIFFIRRLIILVTGFWSNNPFFLLSTIWYIYTFHAPLPPARWLSFGGPPWLDFRATCLISLGLWGDCVENMYITNSATSHRPLFPNWKFASDFPSIIRFKITGVKSTLSDNFEI